MRRDPRVRLTDILRSIDQIRAYTDGLTREGFMDDPLVQDAVIRRLEIIGEAVKGLGQPERSRHPEVSSIMNWFGRWCRSI